MSAIFATLRKTHTKRSSAVVVAGTEYVDASTACDTGKERKKEVFKKIKKYLSNRRQLAPRKGKRKTGGILTSRNVGVRFQSYDKQF